MGIYDTEAGLNTLASGLVAHATRHPERYTDRDGARLVALSNAALTATVGDALGGELETIRVRATDGLPIAGRALDQLSDTLAQSAGDVLLLLGWIQKLEGDLQVLEAERDVIIERAR